MFAFLPDHQRTLVYFFASSIEEALAHLASHPGKACVIGGGTKILPAIQQGNLFISHLVDVTHIGSLKRLYLEEGYLEIGGAVPFKRLATHELVVQRAPLLAEMAQKTAQHPLYRYATLAGNIASAASQEPSLTALIALDAEAKIVNLTGSQWLPLHRLLVRPSVSRVDSQTEILATVRIPLPQGQTAIGATLPLPQKGSKHLIAAVSLILTPQRSLNRLNIAIGTPWNAPQLWRLEDLVQGENVPPEEIGETLVGSILPQIRKNAPPDDLPFLEKLGTWLADLYARALEQAKQLDHPLDGDSRR